MNEDLFHFWDSPVFRVMVGQLMDVNAAAKAQLSDEDYRTFQVMAGAQARAHRALKEIDRLALVEGDLDLLWASAYLRERDDLADGARFDNAELGLLPTAMNIREGLRELERRGLLEIRVEQRGRPLETWSVFVPEDEGNDRPR